jgi:hypothetical protein
MEVTIDAEGRRFTIRVEGAQGAEHQREAEYVPAVAREPEEGRPWVCGSATWGHQPRPCEADVLEGDADPGSGGPGGPTPWSGGVWAPGDVTSSGPGPRIPPGGFGFTGGGGAPLEG